MRKLAVVCIVGGILVLTVAVVLRLMALGPLLANPVVGLWRVSVALLLVAIAIGVNKMM